MSDIRKHSDDLLRDKFLSFEGDIPMSDWDIIADKLDKKRRFAWIWWAAIPLILISGLSILTYHFTQKQSLNENKLVSKSKVIILEKPMVNPKLDDIKNVNPELENASKIGSNSSANEKFSSPKAKSGSPKSANNSSNENTGKDLPLNLNNSIFEILDINSQAVPDLWVALPLKLEFFKLETIIHPKPKQDKTKISISYEAGVSIAPAMGLDKIKENKVRSIHKDYFSSIAGSSVLGSGFNNGLHFQINFGNKWYVRPGIYSSEYSVYHNYNYTYDAIPVINANNEIRSYIFGPPETVNYSGKSSIKYITIPLMLGNRISLTKNWGIESKLGFNVSRLLDASGQWVNPTFLSLESINSNNSIKKWNTGMSISTGLFFKTNKNLIFTVEPNFATMLGSANQKNSPVKTRYYNYGINLNVNYILKGRNR